MIWIDLVIVGALLLGLGLGAKRGFVPSKLSASSS